MREIRVSFSDGKCLDAEFPIGNDVEKWLKGYKNKTWMFLIDAKNNREIAIYIENIDFIAIEPKEEEKNE